MYGVGFLIIRYFKFDLWVNVEPASSLHCEVIFYSLNQQLSWDNTSAPCKFQLSIDLWPNSFSV